MILPLFFVLLVLTYFFFPFFSGAVERHCERIPTHPCRQVKAYLKTEDVASDYVRSYPHSGWVRAEVFMGKIIYVVKIDTFVGWFNDTELDARTEGLPPL